MSPPDALCERLEAVATRLRRDRTALVRYVDVVPSKQQLISWAKRSQWCCVVHPQGVAWLELLADGGAALVRAAGFADVELAAAESVQVFAESELSLFACGCGCR